MPSLLDLFVSISIRGGGREFDRAMREIERRAQRAEANSGVSVSVDVEMAEAAARLDRLRQLRDSASGDARITVEAEIRAAQANLQRIQRLRDSTSGEDVRIRVDADIATAEANLSRLESARRSASGEARIRIDADISAAQGDLERLRGLRERLTSDDASIRIDADVSAAQAEIRRLEQLRDSATSEESRIRIDADVSAAQARLAALEAVRERIDSADVDIRVDVDTGAAVGKLAALGAAAAAMDAGLSAGGVGAVALGGALTVLGALVTPLLGALTTLGSLGAAAGVGLGLIAGPVAALGAKFGEYKKGLDAAGAGQQAVSSSAKTLEGANRSLDQAVARRGQVEQDVTQQTSDAWQSYERQQEKTGQTIQQVAQANSDAWDEYISTREETGRVEDQVSQANADASDALRSARVDLMASTAALGRVQREYNDVLEDEPENQQYAALDLADAYDQVTDDLDAYNEAIREHGKGSEEASDAARRLQRSQLDYGRQQEETTEIQKTGSQELRDSFGQLVSAQTDRINSAVKVGEAEENSSRVAKQGADQIAAARKAETAAFQSYRRTQAEGEQQIREARRSEADQYKAWQRTKAQGDSQLQQAQDAVTQAQLAATEAAAAMGAAQQEAAGKTVVLTQAEQALYDRFQQFKQDAAFFFQPAMDAAARLGVKILDLATLFLPRLGAASTATYGALTSAFEGFRATITAPMQMQSIDTILGITPAVIGSLSSAVGNLAAGLINMFATAAPAAAGLARWIEGISAGFLSWTQSAGGRAEILGWIRSATPVFLALWNMVKNVSGALVSFGTANAPSIARAIDIISGALGAAIRGFGAFVGAIGPFGVVIAALSPIFLGLVLVIGSVASGVAGLLGVVGAVVTAFGGWAVIGGFLSTWLGPAVLVIAGLVAAGVALYRNWDAVKAAAQRLVAYLAPGFAQMRAAVIPVLQAIGAGIRAGLGAALRFVQGQAQRFVAMFRTMWPPLRAAVLPILQAIAGGLRTALGTAFRFLLGQGRQFVAWFRTAFPPVRAAVMPVLQAIANALRVVLVGAFRFVISQAGIVVQFFRTNWPLIRAVSAATFNAVVAIVQQAMRIIGSVIRTVWGAAAAFWRTNSEQILQIARLVWQNVKTVIETALRVILGIVRASMQLLTGDYRGAWDTILEILRTVLAAMQALLRNSLDIIVNLLRVAWQTVRDLTSAAFEAIRSVVAEKIEAVRAVVADKANALKQNAIDAWNALKTATSDAYEAVRASIADKIEAARATAVDKANALKDGAIDAFNRARDGARDAFEAMRGFIVDPLARAYDETKGWINKIIGLVNGILDKVGIDPIPLVGEGSVAGSRAAGPRMMAKGGVTSGKRSHRRGVRFMAEGGVTTADEGGIGTGREILAITNEAGPEAVIAKDQPAHTQVPYLVEAAAWHGLKVGSAGSEPHAHFPDEMMRSAKGRRYVQKEVVGLATGGLFMGVPNGFIKYDYQQYIPGYPYSADQRHKGVDVWGSPSGQTPFNVINDGYAATVQDFPHWSIGAGVAHDAFAKSGGTRGLVAGHLDPAVGTGPIEPGTNLGHTVYFGDNYHVHWQAYDTGVLSSNYTHASPPLMDPKAALEQVAGSIGTPTQGGGGGGFFNPLRALFENRWDAWIQPKVDAFLGPFKDSSNVLMQAVGGLAQKVPDGIKKWALAHPLLAGGGSGETTPMGLGGDPAKNRELGKKMNEAKGWGSQWGSLDSLWTKESGWDNKADNPTSDAYGIPQGMMGPGGHVPPPGYMPPESDAGVQIAWGLDYIAKQHGDPNAAWGHSQANNWYSKGGMATGPQQAVFGETGHELFLPLENRAVMQQARQTFGTYAIEAQMQAMRTELSGIKGRLERGLEINDFKPAATDKILVSGEMGAERFGNTTKARVQTERQIEAIKRRTTMGGVR